MKKTLLYQGKHCPCPSDCSRRTNCKACIAFHHSRGEKTYCEYLYQDIDSGGAPPSDVPAKSGRELRLMDYGPCAGWAGKLNPTRLAGIIEKLPKVASPHLLVGMDTLDDAGVYKLTEDMAVVQSVDFFYPIVNDARSYGRIVAANSLSDIWAMGGKAITAMNVLAYPAGKIPQETIEELLIGGSEKLQEAGVVLVGGHTMEQEEFFYGMSVSGVVHPESILTNSRARAGDVIILTKPLGTGVLCNAYQQDGLTEAQLNAFSSSMERLNLYASTILLQYDISALTDVTGFGLLGHALPIARNANVILRFYVEKIPRFDGISELMERFYAKEVCKTKQYVVDHTRFDDGIDDTLIALLCEAQTSGGLLAAIHPDQAEEAVAAIIEAGDAEAAIIGDIIARTKKGDGVTFLHVFN